MHRARTPRRSRARAPVVGFSRGLRSARAARAPRRPKFPRAIAHAPVACRGDPGGVMKSVHANVAVSGLSVASTLAPGFPVILSLRSEPCFQGTITGFSHDPLDP